MLKPAFPDGHFYSPVINPDEVHAGRRRIWPEVPPELPGLDFRPDRQRSLLRAIAPLVVEFDYAVTAPESGSKQFFEKNGKFEGLDARMLFGLLRYLRPRRLIEVGSGFSSLLAADVNVRFLESRTEITCIEPFPPPFLTTPIPGIDRVVEQKVQEVPLATFEGLSSGDLLFIDSSHVVKTGSDVTFLYLEVLPRISPGVNVHIHDIFLPEDYPMDWVLGEQRSWSEQYLVRALLTYSKAFEVEFGCHYASRYMPSEIREVFGKHYGGGSLWIRRLCS